MVAKKYFVIKAQLRFVMKLLSFAVELTTGMSFPLKVSFINLSEVVRD